MAQWAQLGNLKFQAAFAVQAPSSIARWVDEGPGNHGDCSAVAATGCSNLFEIYAGLYDGGYKE